MDGPGPAAPEFLCEPIEVSFDPGFHLSKRSGVPSEFVWRSRMYLVTALEREWHDYDAPRPATYVERSRDVAAPRARVPRKGSWGHGRDYYQVRTAAGDVFVVYYDRSPEKSARGGWFVSRRIPSAPARSREGG